MLTARYRQDKRERLRYEHDLTSWLLEDETITSVQATAQDITVEDVTPDLSGKRARFVVTGGETGRIYDVTITITTSLGQRKIDIFQFVVV